MKAIHIKRSFIYLMIGYFQNLLMQILQSSLKAPKASPPNVESVCSPVGNQSPVNSKSAVSTNGPNSNSCNNRNDPSKQQQIFQ